MVSTVCGAALAALASTTCAPHAPQPAGGKPGQAALQGATAAGQWFTIADMEYDGVCFGASESSECKFALLCGIDNKAIALVVGHELAPNRATAMTVLTNRTSLSLPAHSHNEPPGSFIAQVAQSQRGALKTALMPAQQRFAIEIGGKVTVLPWYDDIGYLLADCRIDGSSPTGN
jgi:hypothetical protein